MAITVYEDFSNATGNFTNYDTFDSAQRSQIAAQKHVNIRSFEQNPITIPYFMYVLDNTAISTIDTYMMSQLDNGITMQLGENWTAPAVVGPQSDRNNFNGLSMACGAGANPTSSIGAASVDISQFAPTDYISLSLPALPLASLTLGSCFIDFTSQPQGNFAIGPTDSLAFSSSTTTLVAGNSEARFPVSALSNVAKNSITGVRFRIQATGVCTFRCLAIRCISTAWLYGPLDQNTMYDRLEATVPPTGSLTQPYSFPAASPSGNWPILVFSDGATGPTMVDSEVGVTVHTGSNLQTNSLNLYFRMFPFISNTVQTLDGMTMAQLDTLPEQPDGTVGHLEDYSNTQFISVMLQWGTTPTLSIHNQANQGQTYTGLSLSAHTDYYLSVTLRENRIRAQIYPISVNGIVDWSTVVFDSTSIIDSALVIRRLGRLGWYSQINEGDSYVKHLRPRKIVYSEYRSLALNSQTPVEGAQIFPTGTPDQEIFDEPMIPQLGTFISLDNTKSSSGTNFQIKTDGNYVIQGFTSNTMYLDSFEDCSLEFDIYAPPLGFQAALIGEHRGVDIYIPNVLPNRWTHVSLSLDNLVDVLQPGHYALLMVQRQTSPNIWFIDKMSVIARSISWQGRAAADPWKMNDPSWIKFRSTLNNRDDGILFDRSSAFQIRGQALTPDAVVDEVRILPKYAQLGNFSWRDQAPNTNFPTASFTSSVTGTRTIQFDGSASTAPNGFTDYYWTFGDGTYAYGQIVTHVYTTSGSYNATLTIIDHLALKNSITHSVSA